MKAIRIVPKGRPEMIEVENTLEGLQDAVDGRIESVPIMRGLDIICDEEWRGKDKPYNYSFFGVEFGGTILLVGVDGEDYTDCPVTVREVEDYLFNF